MSYFVNTPGADGLLKSPTAQVAILNSQGRIIGVNEVWRQSARENGCTDGNVFVDANYLTVCENALQMEYDITAEGAYLGLQSILRGEQSEFSIEYLCPFPDGERWFVMRAIGVQLFKNIYVFVVHDDITQLRASLGKAETRFHNFIQSLPDVVYTLDLKTRQVTSFNRDSFLGYTREELMAPGSIQQNIHPDDVPSVAAHWREILGAGTSTSIEYRVKNKAGQWEWVDSRKTAMSTNLDGTPSEITVVLRVITNRKQTEEQIVYHARILENVNDVIIGTDENFVIRYWNAAAERTFGWRSEEVVGKGTSEILRTIFSGDGSEDPVRAIRRTGKWKGEVIQFTKDDQPVNIDANIMTIRNEAGKITGFVSANRDITKRKQVEENLIQAKSAIEAANLELQKALIREQQLARTDSLTGILNRRHFFSLAEHEFSVAERYGMRASIIIFDIDHFKQVNDRWGHQVGDDVLRRVSHIAREQVRAADVLARYGGEEFIVFLPNSSADEAANVAERIRRDVMSYRIDPERTQAYITVSVGIAERTVETESLDHLIRHADQALYAAKEAGRNCVRVYDEGGR